MKTFAASLLMAFPVFAVSSALAQHETFNVDGSTSKVAFSLSDPLHSVHGTFHIQNGLVDFNRGGTDISGSVVVAAGSGNSGSESRDHKMSTDILDAPKFAIVSFAPHNYQGTIAATGDSTI